MAFGPAPVGRVVLLPERKGDAMRTSRLVPLAACAGLALSWSGCGGSSPSSPTSAAVPTPVPCTRTTILQGSGPLPANTAGFDSFTTTALGRLDVTLDWTFADSPMALFVARQPCEWDQFRAGTCSMLLQLYSPPKPLKGTIDNLPAGTYRLVIGNGRSEPESVSIQMVLSSPGCPAASSAASQAEHAPFPPFREGLVGVLR